MGGIIETSDVFGRTQVQKGLMAPSPSRAQGGTQHAMSGQMDLKKTMTIPYCGRNKMTPEDLREARKS